MTILRLLPLLLLLSVATTSAQQTSSLERRVPGQRHAEKERRRLRHFPNERVSQKILDSLRNLQDSEDAYRSENLDEPDRYSKNGKKKSVQSANKGSKKIRHGVSKSKHLTAKSARSAKRPGKKSGKKPGKKSGKKSGKRGKKSGMDSGGGGDQDGDANDSGEEDGMESTEDGGGDQDGDANDGTLDPTLGPALEPSLQPDRIDFTDCDSFSTSWALELAISCVEVGNDLINCECPTSANLLAIGTLTCATQEERLVNPPACPLGCPVCEFCMVLNGCEDIYQGPSRL